MWHKIRITFFDLCLPAVKKLFPILAKKTKKNYLNLNGFVVGDRVAAYGIDISKLTFDVAICNSESKYKYFKFANNHEGFIMFLELLNASESICVMEASDPYYLKLATFLSASGIDVCVINPLIIRRFSQMRMSRAKTDKKDAMLIAEYGKTETHSLWQPEEN